MRYPNAGSAMCHICNSFHLCGRCVIRLRLRPRLLQFLALVLRNYAMRLFIPDSVGPLAGITSPKYPVDSPVRDVRKSQLIKDFYLFISAFDRLGNRLRDVCDKRN